MAAGLPKHHSNTSAQAAALHEETQREDPFERPPSKTAETALRPRSDRRRRRSTQVAEWAGHGIETLLRIHAECLGGGVQGAKKRLLDALPANDLREETELRCAEGEADRNLTAAPVPPNLARGDANGP